jgi:hypothetical protein
VLALYRTVWVATATRLQCALVAAPEGSVVSPGRCLIILRHRRLASVDDESDGQDHGRMHYRLGLAVVVVFACSKSETPAGQEGGPCYGNGTCNDTLACRSNLCVDLGAGGSGTAGQGGAGGTGGGSGGGDSPAATCAGTTYILGCIGDGRTPELTTDGSKPTSHCGLDDYVYFDLDLRIGNLLTPRSDIDHCTLDITGVADPWWRQTFDLPSGEISGTQHHYGCSPGQTSQSLGHLSYSCCHPPDVSAPAETLWFRLAAFGSDGSLVAMDDIRQSCARPEGGWETQVVLSATQGH